MYLIAANWCSILLPATAGTGASEKKTRHLQDSSGVCPCLQLGSFSDPHAGQCLNPWGIWFDFLFHLPYTELRVNIVELKWRLMFRYWCVSKKEDIKWKQNEFIHHTEKDYTSLITLNSSPLKKTWNSNLIQSRAIICSIRAQECSFYSTITSFSITMG